MIDVDADQLFWEVVSGVCFFGVGIMKFALVLTVAGILLAAAPAMASEYKAGEWNGKGRSRDSLCGSLTEKSWAESGVTRVSSCNCYDIQWRDAPGVSCTVAYYVWEADRQSYSPPNAGGYNSNPYGNIYNNPYGGTTTVLPGVR